MSEYAVAAGIIQFDPAEREANGQDVRDITIKAIGTQKLIRVTVWPEFASTPLAKGDFVAVDGKFSQSLGQAKDGSPREYVNISATTLAVVASAVKAEREVVQKATATADAPLF